MLKMQQSPLLSISPSFNSYSNTRLVDIAARVCEEVSAEAEQISFADENHSEQSSVDPPLEIAEEEEDCESDDDFEFALVTRDPSTSPISADEIFFNGQIRPIFPIFDQKLIFSEGNEDDDDKGENASSIRLPLRKLLIEDREPTSSSSSEADDIEAIPAGTYCVWKPKQVTASPDRCKKSNSTGSSKRWRFRDLLHRSNSDGKDTYVFLTPATTSAPKKKEGKVENTKEKTSREKKTGKAKLKGIYGEKVSPHEILYVRNRAMKEEDRRRSYLPYKQDLVGFFANANGLGRNLHPF